MDLQKRVNNASRPDSEPLSTLNPELPFTEIVRQEFVDEPSTSTTGHGLAGARVEPAGSNL